MGQEKEVDLTKYPEGLEELAEKLNLPIPPEAKEQRKAMVMGIITGLVRQ